MNSTTNKREKCGERGNNGWNAKTRKISENRETRG